MRPIHKMHTKLQKKTKNIVVVTSLLLVLLYFILSKDETSLLGSKFSSSISSDNDSPPQFMNSGKVDDTLETGGNVDVKSTSAVISHGRAIKTNLDLIIDKEIDDTNTKGSGSSTGTAAASTKKNNNEYGDDLIGKNDDLDDDADNDGISNEVNEISNDGGSDILSDDSNKAKSNLEESGLLEDHTADLIEEKKKSPSSPGPGATSPNKRKKPSPKSINKLKIQNKETNESLNKIIDDDEDENYMPKLVNETIKAELGRATWKLFHTILARYPEKPSSVQKEHVSSFLDSFVHVYPCGDCARHFSKLLERYPPQLHDRKTAALWGCHIHNKVNERLDKPIYDCSGILEDYDCGCGEDETEENDEMDITTTHTESKSTKSKMSLDSESEYPEGEVSTDLDLTTGEDEELGEEVKLSKSELQETNDHLQSINIESSEELVHG